MRNIRLIVQYDGSGFRGFQKQTNARTVQQELEKAASALVREPVRIIGAGRTDAGVHATGMVVNFECPDSIPLKRLKSAFARMLPPDITVSRVETAADDFHARYSAVARTYEYTILNRRKPDALAWRFVWHFAQNLDIEAMVRSADLMLGSQDFLAFGTPEKGRSSRRDVFELSVRKTGSVVKVRLKANAFLQHMARGIVGALVDIGSGRYPEGEIGKALERPEDSVSFTIAPPQGLCLVCVEYD